MSGMGSGPVQCRFRHILLAKTNQNLPRFRGGDTGSPSSWGDLAVSLWTRNSDHMGLVCCLPRFCE